MAGGAADQVDVFGTAASSRFGLCRPSRLLALALLTCIALLACGQAPNGSAANAGADLTLQGLLKNSVDLGSTPPTTPVAVTLQLVDPAPAARAEALGSIYDPTSPNYLHFMDQAAQAEAFGPDPAQARSVVGHLKAAGLAAEWNPGSGFITADGTAAAVEHEFGVSIHEYRSLSRIRFHAATEPPAVPEALAPAVTGILPINTYPLRHTHFVSQGGVTPGDMATAYGVTGLRAAGGDGSGQTVGIWALGDGFSQKDLDTFTDKAGLPKITPTIISGPKNAKPGAELEMDIESVHAMAPNAAIHVATDSQDHEGSMFDHLLADRSVTVWSMSWGGCETLQDSQLIKLELGIMERAAAAGVSIFFSTGDSAAYDCMTADWGAPPSDRSLGIELPAALPAGVTAVGGTRLSLRRDGTYAGEVVWSAPFEVGGEGAGVSTVFDQPTWQRGPGVTGNKDNPRHARTVPDVVADADPQSGMAIFVDGSWSQGGGTSLATPLWSGMAAAINTYLVRKGLKKVGFVNPALYDLAAAKPAFAPFHDITVGNNLRYAAGPGFDVATGLGSPDAWNLARDLETYQRNGGRP